MPDVARCIVNESREVCVIFFYPRNIAIRVSGQSLSGSLILSVKLRVEYFDNVYAIVTAREIPMITRWTVFLMQWGAFPFSSATRRDRNFCDVVGPEGNGAIVAAVQIALLEKGLSKESRGPPRSRT
jgi:hypothetical protein